MEIIKRKEFVTLLSNKLDEREYASRLSKRYSYWDLYWIIKAIYECMTDILREGNKLYVADCFTLFPKYKKEKIAGNFGKPCVSHAHYVPYMLPMQRWKDICRELDVSGIEQELREKEKRKVNGKNNKKHG